MRRTRTAKRIVSRTVSLPPPVGGLNTRDSVAIMPETDAVIMTNLFPQETSVNVRSGYVEHATFPGIAESLFDYTSVAESLFVGVRNGATFAIYDATAGGALGPPVVGGSLDTVQPLTGCRFDTVNFGTTGGQFLLACNGVDPMLQYDGSAWSAAAITGITPGTDSISSLAVYGSRIWLMQRDSFNVWYLGVNAIAGAATQLNLGSLFKLGGSLSNIVTWSSASASDTADYIAFVSTEGEVAVYTGDDPASAATWARVAHFRIGRPVTSGNRCWSKLGAEAIIVCADGVTPLAKAAMLGRDSTEWSVSNKIDPVVVRDIGLYSTSPWWSIIVHPIGSKLIVSVPVASSGHQYVMNTQTKAWCRFTGWAATAWDVVKDSLYFAGYGFVARADAGDSDGGLPIEFDCQQAYSYFGQRGQQKQFTMARPIFQLTGPVTMRLGMNVDYFSSVPESQVSLEGAMGDPWGGIWDIPWIGALSIVRGWQSVGGLGYCGGTRIAGSLLDTTLSWMSTDIVFQPGSTL